MVNADPMADIDLLTLDRQVCYALSVASRNVIGLYRPILEPMGLTHPQYLVMLVLWEEGPQSLIALAEALSMESATLSPLLKRLETAGYLRRERDPGDGRALQIALTEEGAALREQALTIPPRIIERLGMELSELEQLRLILHRVIAQSS